MDVRHLDDPAAWLRVVEPFLLEDEARHNLHFGLATMLLTQPEVYPDKHLWIVTDRGEPVGAALQTPPHNLALARPATPSVAETLADAIVRAGIGLPGVTAAVPEVRTFADAWHARTGEAVRVVMAQGIYALREVSHLPAPSGASREASADDLDLILAWNDAFIGEAVPDERGDLAARRRRIESAFASDDRGFWLWVDEGEPVSMTGFSRSTPNGCRIGPVYTPRSYRGHGYATGLVADVSRDQLARGRRFCFLYTDMANPTSNAIYVRIGYQLVCDSEELAFGAA